MVSEILTGIGMREDRELAAVEHQPLRDFAELRRSNGELATSAWMRPNRTQVIMTFGHTEPVTGGMAQCLRLLELVGVEIDVGVEIADHALPMHLQLERVQKSVERGDGFGLVQFGRMADTGHDD